MVTYSATEGTPDPDLDPDPCQPHLLTPYPDLESDPQQRYNIAHSRT